MIIPLKLNEAEYSLFVVLEQDNLARMRENDPAEITLSKLPDEFKVLRLRDLIITTPSVKDLNEAMEMVKNNDFRSALKHLTRGWYFRKEMGDKIIEKYDSPDSSSH